MFYLLSGTAEFRCDGQALHAGPGDFVLLPVGLPHTFIVGADEPLRARPRRRAARPRTARAAPTALTHDRKLPNSTQHRLPPSPLKA
jgi:uncharacterized RmlC-like cupin family protein